MNKQELIKKVALDAGITQKQAGAALESALAAIKAAVADGQKVQLIGFGTFESKKREAREGRNPRTVQGRGQQVSAGLSRRPSAPGSPGSRGFSCLPAWSFSANSEKTIYSVMILYYLTRRTTGVIML